MCCYVQKSLRKVPIYVFFFFFLPNIPTMVFIFLKKRANMSALPRNIYLKAHFEK